MLIIEAVTSLSVEVNSLIQASRCYQAELYPPESIHQEDPQALLDKPVYFVGAYRQRKLLGIAAIKRVEASPAYGEIKNLFVDPRYRGQGVSRALMAALEAHLVEAGILQCRLETGIRQLESIGLYHSLGYQECPAFGGYEPDPLSLFMQKNLQIT